MSWRCWTQEEHDLATRIVAELKQSMSDQSAIAAAAVARLAEHGYQRTACAVREKFVAERTGMTGDYSYSPDRALTQTSIMLIHQLYREHKGPGDPIEAIAQETHRTRERVVEALSQPDPLRRVVKDPVTLLRSPRAGSLGGDVYRQRGKPRSSSAM